jgi:hypothetical protein
MIYKIVDRAIAKFNRLGVYLGANYNRKIYQTLVELVFFSQDITGCGKRARMCPSHQPLAVIKKGLDE